MADYNLVGRIRPVYKGVWNPNTDYTVLDTVIAADGHASYMAKKTVPAGTPLESGSYWGAVVDASATLKAAENAVGEVRAEASEKASALRTKVSGNPVQIYPDAGSILKPVSVLNPMQAGSGIPQPGGFGKNLLPSLAAGTYTVGDLTAVANKDGSIVINGANTGSGNADLAIIPATSFPAGKYTISGCPAGGSNNTYRLYCRQYDASGNAKLYHGEVGEGLTITLLDGESLRFDIRIVRGSGAISNLVFRPQMEAGTVKTEYEPYANIRTITGRTGGELARAGKNLMPNVRCNTLTYNGITFTNNGDGSYAMSGTATSQTPFLDVEAFELPAGAYILSGCHSALGQIRSEDGQTIYGTSNDQPFAIDAPTIVKFRQYVSAGDTFSNAVFKPMIRLASITDATYEPYHGDTFTLDFGQTVYGGTLDWNNGELMVDTICKTLVGTEVWVGAGTEFVDMLAFNAGMPDKYDGWITVLSNMFPPQSQDQYPSNTIGIGGYGKNITIKIPRSMLGGATGANADHVSDFKAWLSAQNAAGTPVQIAYKLAAPITIQLAPQQITALDGINTVYTDGDSLSVDYNKSMRRAFDEVVARLAALEATVTNT